MMALRQLLWLVALLVTVAPTCVSAKSPLRNIMYLTGQHPVIPNRTLSSPITHVVLAFMQSHMFNVDSPGTEWPIFMSVEEVRSQFRAGTKVMVAIGGWGDTEGFDIAARTEESRQRFARNVAIMVRDTGADGVDIDWEYPGGNGEDYKQTPNSKKAWEIEAYPQLLAAIRAVLGSEKLISAAVPGLPRDMLAFTPDTLPRIMESADFLNVMTYDLMNRRDSVTKHHTGVQVSLESIRAYAGSGPGGGVAPERLNLGFAFYVKFFRIAPEHRAACLARPVGCPTGLMEDPKTGGDLGRTGGFSWHDAVPAEVTSSFRRAQELGTYDEEGGGYYYFDEGEDLWWTFDTPTAILRKFPLVVDAEGLGGVFAWGLGEDAPAFSHLAALNNGIRKSESIKDEL
ncbi:chitinase 18-4 [Xylariales sp. PMI_506]|nr:chitinase 18-4 [Xylariales sp. PMI_506]